MLKERCVILKLFFNCGGLSRRPSPFIILPSSSFFPIPTACFLVLLPDFLLHLYGHVCSFFSPPRRYSLLFLAALILASSPPSHHPPLIPCSTLLSILIGCVETNMLLFFSPASVLLIGICSPRWSSVGGQTGTHDCVHVRVCTHTGDESECVCVCVCVWMCWEVRGGVEETLWVWELACVCVCVTSHAPMDLMAADVLLVRQIGVHALREESAAASAGDPRLVWWPFESTLRGTCRPETRAHCVTCWESVTLWMWACFYPCGKAHSVEIDFYYLHSCAHLMRVLFCWRSWLPNSWVFFFSISDSSPFLPSFLFPPFTVNMSTCVLATAWMPSQDVLIGWLGFHSIPKCSLRRLCSL